MMSEKSVHNGIMLLNHDCLQVMDTLNDECIDLIVTDPPILRPPEVTLVIAVECYKSK